MNKLPVKIIALDLDDTLLNDERQISDENVAVIKECAEKGIYVVLCSGRVESGMLSMVHRLDIAGTEYGRYIAALNGCSIFDLHTRKQIYSKTVDPEILVRADKMAEEIGLRSQIYNSGAIYFREATKWTVLDGDLCGLQNNVAENYDEMLKQGSTKMLVAGEPEKLQVLMERFKTEFGDKAVVFTSKPYFLELLPPNCGKGVSVLWLADYLGISHDATMSFGDSMNDENMIRLCKYSVAMKNGLDYIKNIATFVSEEDNNHSGVGDFIKKYVL